MWQVGCLAWWLATGSDLFSDSYSLPQVTVDAGTREEEEDEDTAAPLDAMEQHLAAMACNLGPFPAQVRGAFG